SPASGDSSGAEAPGWAVPGPDRPVDADHRVPASTPGPCPRLDPGSSVSHAQDDPGGHAAGTRLRRPDHPGGSAPETRDGPAGDGQFCWTPRGQLKHSGHRGSPRRRALELQEGTEAAAGEGTEYTEAPPPETRSPGASVAAAGQAITVRERSVPACVLRGEALSSTATRAAVGAARPTMRRAE